MIITQLKYIITGGWGVVALTIIAGFVISALKDSSDKKKLMIQNSPHQRKFNYADFLICNAHNRLSSFYGGLV